jgi:hypothetical protein
MTETHTPTPWLSKEDGYEIYITSPDYDNNGYEIAIVDILGLDGKQADLQRVNAEFIVRAVNAHDDLVAVLKRVIIWGSPKDQGCHTKPFSSLLVDLEAALAKLEQDR